MTLEPEGFFASNPVPNEVIRTLLDRRTIRRFKDEPLRDEVIGWIAECGLRAPSSGGAQAPTLLVCTDKTENERFGRMSRELYDEGPYKVSIAQPSIADDASLADGFYGAPVVVHVFTPRGYPYSPYDAAMSGCYMMLAAWSLGVGSCYVSRADRLFEMEAARAFASGHGIPDDYEGACHLCLGYPESTEHSPKPLYPGRIHFA